MTDIDLDELERLRKQYEPTAIPPCSVCGGKLSLQACGGGEPSVWACDGLAYDADGNYAGYESGRRPVDEHYIRSKFIDRRQGGDPGVVALCAEVRELRERVAAYERGKGLVNSMARLLACDKHDTEANPELSEPIGEASCLWCEIDELRKRLACVDSSAAEGADDCPNATGGKCDRLRYAWAQTIREAEFSQEAAEKWDELAEQLEAMRQRQERGR